MTTRTDQFNLLIAGVGGQGVLTLGSLIVHAAVQAGFDVKQSEIHGMAQRGGSVSSHVRIGRKIFSPVIEEGTADIILALEKLEALRYPQFLSPDGLLIVDDRAIPPLPVSSGTMEYPPDVLDRCRLCATRVEVYSGDELAKAIGSPRMLNTAFAGILSRHMPFDESAWRQAITEQFADRHREANLHAFQTGRAAKPIP